MSVDRVAGSPALVMRETGSSRRGGSRYGRGCTSATKRLRPDDTRPSHRSHPSVDGQDGSWPGTRRGHAAGAASSKSVIARESSAARVDVVSPGGRSSGGRRGRGRLVVEDEERDSRGGRAAQDDARPPRRGRVRACRLAVHCQAPWGSARRPPTSSVLPGSSAPFRPIVVVASSGVWSAATSSRPVENRSSGDFAMPRARAASTVRRERWIDGRRSGHLVVQMRPEHGRLVLSHVRNRAGEALEEHAGKRVDVRPAVDPRPADLLGGDVVDRPEQLAASRHTALRIDLLRQAEVGQVGDRVPSRGRGQARPGCFPA